MVLGKLTHTNCCKDVDQTIIAKWSELEMNRTVFKHFIPEISIPQYPQIKQISKQNLSKFLNHSLIKASYKYCKTPNQKNVKKYGKQILLSMRDSIQLRLTNKNMRLSFRPIFKDPDCEYWYPLP